MAITTLGEAKDKVLRAVHEEDSAYISEDDVKDWISYCQINTLGDKFFAFMDDKVIFNSSADTITVADITSGDSEIEVSSNDDLSTTGTVYIGGLIVVYTGKGTAASGNDSITGCTGVTADIDTTANVRQIYGMTGLGISYLEKPDYLEVDGVEKVYYDGRGEIKDSGYTIIDDYLYLPYSDEVEPVIFRYTKYATSISDDSDTFLIPERYRNMLIEYATWKVKTHLQYPDATSHQIEFNRLKKQFMAHYGHQTNKTNNFIPSPYR